MIKSFLRLSLGVLMIVAASVVLLLTDKGSHRAGLGSSDANPADNPRVFSVALFQHVSQPIQDEGAKGVIAGLAAAGYRTTAIPSGFAASMPKETPRRRMRSLASSSAANTT